MEYRMILQSGYPNPIGITPDLPGELIDNDEQDHTVISGSAVDFEKNETIKNQLWMTAEEIPF